MRYIVFLTVLLSVMFSTQPGVYSESPPPEIKFSARVKVEVNCSDDKDIEAQIGSFVTRELRSLGDVTVVESEPEWVIEILAMPTKSQSGYKTGVVLSAVFFNVQHSSIMLKLLKYWVLSEDKLKAVESLETPDVRKIEGHIMQAGSEADVRSNCEKLVTSFDSRCLSPWRKSWQETQDFIRKYLKDSKPSTTP